MACLELGLVTLRQQARRAIIGAVNKLIPAWARDDPVAALLAEAAIYSKLSLEQRNHRLQLVCRAAAKLWKGRPDGTKSPPNSPYPKSVETLWLDLVRRSRGRTV